MTTNLKSAPRISSENFPEDIVREGLVFHLDFSLPECYSGTGTVVNDLSDNPLTGTTVSCIWNSEGYFFWNNVNVIRRIDFPYDAKINFTNSFTLEAWVLPTLTKTDNHGDTILSHGLSPDGNSADYEVLLVKSSTYPSWRVRIYAGVNSSIGANDLPTAEVTHVAFTFDGGLWTMYKNGILIEQYNTINQSISTGTESLVIGVRWKDITNTTNSSFWRGNIYQVRMYNAPLTHKQVIDNMRESFTRISNRQN